MDIEKVKENIRAMLNLANNPAAHAGEIAAAMRFASKLMEENQLSEEDVVLNKVEEKMLDLEKAEMGKASVYATGATHLMDWHSNAASWVCAFVGGVKWYYRDKVPHKVDGILQCYPRSGKPKLKTLITFYGVAEDVQIAIQVFEEITMTIIAMAKLKFGVVYRGSGLSYCEGFVSGLWDKYYKDRDSQKKLANQPTSGSTALMVIDQRQALVKRKEELATQWLEASQGKLGKGRASRGRSSIDWNARNEGKADGSKYSGDNSRRKKLT